MQPLVAFSLVGSTCLRCETDTVGLQEPSPRPPTTCRIYPRGGLDPVNFSSVNHGLAVPGLAGACSSPHCFAAFDAALATDAAHAAVLADVAAFDAACDPCEVLVENS